MTSPAEVLQRWWSRACRTIPQPVPQQTGVTIVTILFGLVISQLALDIAEQVVETVRGIPMVSSEGDLNIAVRDAWDERVVVFSHLAVVVALTVTSAIGYYTSQNLPRLRVRFFNKALVQFVLDVLMVLMYFLALQFAEEVSEDASVNPEAVLVFISFMLYVCWDFVSFLTSRDSLAQVALGRVPRTRPYPYGYRRWVTAVFALLSLSVVLVSFYDGMGHRDRGTVIVLDGVLVILLLGYRVAKSVGDATIEYRTATSGSGEVAEADLKQVLDVVVYHNRWFLEKVYKAEGQELTVPLSAPGTRSVVELLVTRGALVPFLADEADFAEQEELTVKLTDQGRAACLVE